jgi:hypothetical protein
VEKRYQSAYGMSIAPRRRLRIYATDPMSGRRSPYRITIDIENEPELEEGPRGSIVEVWDWDGAQGYYYAPVNLNQEALLMEAGLAPSESDPRFHQQMVYAVAMKVVESARRALGRPIDFYRTKRRPRLKLIPHAFCGANAFFDKKLNAILFGYFQASRETPGPNLPGQMVFTCLSHDVIAHEMTHAIVNRLRPYFLEPTNVDVLAFHEGFSDIVALFQRFTYHELLVEHVQSSGARLEEASGLIGLAQQVGYATGGGKALRSAIGTKDDPKALNQAFEPHHRGAILVSAVFDGYFRTYENRISDLLRIATGGSGILPQGRLHPDLTNRLAREAAYVADRVLRMCFRAFDYMPPVDVTFGDFLCALVTSDYELDPEDRDELRYNMIEGFRKRGIYSSTVRSLAEESLLWPSAIDQPPPPLDNGLLTKARSYLAYSAAALDVTGRSRDRRRDRQAGSRSALDTYRQISIDGVDEKESPDVQDERDLQNNVFGGLQTYGQNNSVALGLDPDLSVRLSGFHPVQRLGSDQRLIVEFVAQFTQKNDATAQNYGGLPLRAGTTVVFGVDGAPRYVIAKPMPSPALADNVKKAADDRAARIGAFIETMDLHDPLLAWGEENFVQRMERRCTVRHLHEGTL